MLRFSPILIAVLIGWLTYRFSAAKTKRDLSANSTPLEDTAVLKLLQNMASALDIPKIKVFIYNIEPVNGLASPDGRIFITRGFFNKYRNGEVNAKEISSVIAHELGHVALGHTTRRMVDFSGQNAMRIALSMAIGRFVPVVGPWLANLLVGLLAAGLSRKDEFEADAYGAALLHKSGIGLGAQISLFNKLEAWSPIGGGQAAWLMSHPKTTLRIEAIEKLAKAWNI